MFYFLRFLFSFLGFFCKVPAKQISSKVFYSFFLHHLIERDLLIMKNNFLPHTNTFFRSKTTKCSEGVVFCKKNTSFSKCAKFSSLFFFQLLKIVFLDSASKTEYREVVKSIPDPNSIGVAASNRIECTTYSSIL